MKKFWNVNEPTNEIFIYGDITNAQLMESDYTAHLFAQDLKKFGGREFSIRINSNGGDVFAAIAISTLIKNYKARVTIYIDGICASAATLIAVSGDRVIMAKNALLMTHAPTIGVCDFLTEEDLQTMQESLSKVKRAIQQIYADRLKQSTDIFLSTAENWYTAEEALEAGFIDEIGEDAELKVDDSTKKIFYNSVLVKGDYTKLKGKLKMEDKNLLNKIKNLLSGENKSEVQNSTQIRDQEISRIKILNEARSENAAANAIIDAAIAKGATLEEVQDYISAIGKVTDTSKTAQAIYDLIKDNLESGAGGVGGSYEPPENQAALIAKYANNR